MVGLDTTTEASSRDSPAASRIDEECQLHNIVPVVPGIGGKLSRYSHRTEIF